MKTATPSAETHPNVFAWFYLVKRFTDTVRATWGGAAAGGKPAAKPAASKKEDKPKAGGDDDMDLFGEDEEEDEVSSLFNSSKRYSCMIYRKPRKLLLNKKPRLPPLRPRVVKRVSLPSHSSSSRSSPGKLRLTLMNSLKRFSQSRKMVSSGKQNTRRNPLLMVSTNSSSVVSARMKRSLLMIYKMKLLPSRITFNQSILPPSTRSEQSVVAIILHIIISRSEMYSFF